TIHHEEFCGPAGKYELAREEHSCKEAGIDRSRPVSAAAGKFEQGEATERGCASPSSFHHTRTLTKIRVAKTTRDAEANGGSCRNPIKRSSNRRKRSPGSSIKRRKSRNRKRTPDVQASFDSIQ